MVLGGTTVVLSVLLRDCNRFHQGSLEVEVVAVVVVVILVVLAVVEVVVLVVEVVVLVVEVVVDTVAVVVLWDDNRSRQEVFSVEVGIRFHHFLKYSNFLKPNTYI